MNQPNQAADAEWCRTRLAEKILALTVTNTDIGKIIPDLSVFRYEMPTTPIAVKYEPSVAVVVQGTKRVCLGETAFEYDPSRFLLTSLDLPVTSQVTQASKDMPYLCIRLKIHTAMVRELLGKDTLPDPGPGKNDAAMTTGETTPALLAAFLRLADLVDSPQDAPFLGPLIEQEIVYRLLQSSAGQRLRAIATQGDHSQRTARALNWIQANYTAPLRVHELAEIAGMGLSTFHRHFLSLTAMSPLQYQKFLRLHAARHLMLTENADAASAAYAVGYESPSQFSREYSRLFGQSPLRDVREILHNDLHLA